MKNLFYVLELSFGEPDWRDVCVGYYVSVVTICGVIFGLVQDPLGSVIEIAVKL